MLHREMNIVSNQGGSLQRRVIKVLWSVFNATSIFKLVRCGKDIQVS